MAIISPPLFRDQILSLCEGQKSGHIYPGEPLRAVARVPERTALSQFLTRPGDRQLLLQLSTRQSGRLMFWTPAVRIAFAAKHPSWHCEMLMPSVLKGTKNKEGPCGPPPRLPGQALVERSVGSTTAPLPSLLPSPLTPSLGPFPCVVVSSWFGAC